MVLGRYRGRIEENPSVLQYRYVGEFKLLKYAKIWAEKRRNLGKKVKIVKYTDGVAVLEMRRHDAWGKSFKVDLRRK